MPHFHEQLEDLEIVGLLHMKDPSWEEFSLKSLLLESIKINLEYLIFFLGLKIPNVLSTPPLLNI